jgi:hypothetical protein
MCLVVCVQGIPTYVGSLYIKNKLYLQRQFLWSFVHETLNENCVRLYRILRLKTFTRQY